MVLMNLPVGIKNVILVKHQYLVVCQGENISIPDILFASILLITLLILGRFYTGPKVLA